MRKRKADPMFYAILAAALVVLDQIVKYLVRAHIPLGGAVPFIPYLLELTYVQNTGAAFSFLAGSDLTWLLAIVSLIATMVIALALRKDFFPGPWGRLSLSLLLAGAAGNLIDRAALGYVTDMFKTVFIDFPVFNVADICVVCGGVLMIVYVLFFYDKDKDAEAPAPDAPEDSHDQP